MGHAATPIAGPNLRNDTVIVFDGLLRSKIFSRTLFQNLMTGFATAIERHRKEKRRIYLTGVAKHCTVLDRYQLVMSLEGILRTKYPAYLEIPRTVEAKA